MPNFYILYKIYLWSLNRDSKFTLLSSLFGAVKLNKNADPDKYSYSGYGVWHTQNCFYDRWNWVP